MQEDLVVENFLNDIKEHFDPIERDFNNPESVDIVQMFLGDCLFYLDQSNKDKYQFHLNDIKIRLEDFLTNAEETA